MVSGRWAKGTSGAPRQVEWLANDSCAARSYDAAPSPKMRSDIDNMIAANRKRKPGSMGARNSCESWRTGTRWPLVEVICRALEMKATNQLVEE
jgi:hypothetical protein